MNTKVSAFDQLVRAGEASFNRSDWDSLSRHWHAVARACDVQEQPVAATLLDVRLVLFRTSAGVSMARDQCPHRGVPLSMGCVKNDELVCPYHGLTFRAQGECTKVPAQPGLKPGERFRLGVFPSVERYGLIWTCLVPTCLVPDSGEQIPPMPTWGAEGHQAVLPPPVDIGGSAGRQVEGFVDVAHFAFVHQEAFADPDQPEVPTYETTVTDQGVRSDYWSTVSNYPKGLQHLAPEGFRWLRVYEVFPPFTARLTVHFPNEGRLNILNVASPVSAHQTRLFVPITRNFDTTGSVEEVYAFNAQVFAEDQAIVERQWPQDLPLDPMAEAHFAADRTSMAYRRCLKNMGLSFKRPQ